PRQGHRPGARAGLFHRGRALWPHRHRQSGRSATPARHPHPRDPAAPRHAHQRPVLSRRGEPRSMPHILIVEDETIIRSALRRLLERNQYEVSEAGSVQEAQERFSISGFDLIISDLRLPGAPGTELIRLAEGAPVLIMTSYASLRSAVDSMKLGAVDYIAKPFDHDDMLQAVARIH